MKTSFTILIIAFSVVIGLGAQPVQAQHAFRWKGHISAGLAFPHNQHTYYLTNGYPDLSITGNLNPGYTLQIRFARILTPWCSLGAGFGQTRYSSIRMPQGNSETDLSLDLKNTSLHLQLSLPNRKLSPFVRVATIYQYGKYQHQIFRYSISEKFIHSGDANFPQFLGIHYEKPVTHEYRLIPGLETTAGLEMQAGDKAGLFIAVSYSVSQTRRMTTVRENLIAFHYEGGIFIRMGKHKQPYL